MKNWPWVTIVLTLALAVNPLGLDGLHNAFMSGEALSRGIWLPIVLVTAVVLMVLGLAEWFLKRVSRNRRVTAAASDRGGA